MNAKRIETVLGTMVLLGALTAGVALYASLQEEATQARHEPASAATALSVQEIAERDALLAAYPTRRDAERMRIEAIARAQGHSQQRARAIADAEMAARYPGAGIAGR